MITDEQIGFRTGDLDQIKAVLRRYPSVQRAILFGSRAKGNHKHGSDVDIALFVDGNDDTASIRGNLNDELLLPYKFDVLNYHHVQNPDLVDQINRSGQLFYDRTKDTIADPKAVS